MKNLNNRPPVYLFVSYYLIKLVESIFRPLKGIPTPDFNNEYDSTML